MIHYSRILQTGIQSLLAVACGWACGRWQVVEAEPTVQYTNTLVLRFCIPCLQIWLLAVKTDMQQADNWRALAAFLVWSLGLQALLTLHQLVTRQHLQLDRLGVDGLILTTNNTGILGPVVLQAAVGAQYAPLGMLATVALYFQQLPLAQLLFQAHQQQQQPREQLVTTADSGIVDASAFSSKLNGLKVATSPEPCNSSHVNGLHAGMRAMNGVSSTNSDSSSSSSLLLADSNHQSHLQHLRHIAATSHASAASPSSKQQQQHQQQHSFSVDTEPSQSLAHELRGTQHRNGFGSTGSLLSHGQHQAGPHARRLSWDLEQQQQQQQHVTAEAGGCSDSRLLLSSTGRLPQQQGFAAYTLSLFLKNPLVWSTAVAVLLSALGSAALLDPNSPLALKHLAFIDALLGWFAQTTAPLTLFTTGLWMYSNSQQQQQQQQPAYHSVGTSSKGNTSVSGSDGKGVAWSAYGSRTVAWKDVFVYLLLRATLAPAFMVLVCRAMGFRGDLAHALVILALLPVAQTAFVVCKQAETGMAAVSAMLVGSLFMMLPQLMVVLAALERLGVLAEDV